MEVREAKPKLDDNETIEARELKLDNNETIEVRESKFMLDDK